MMHLHHASSYRSVAPSQGSSSEQVSKGRAMGDDALSLLAALFQWLQDNSQTCAASTFRRDALVQLKAIIAFDRAIWADANIADGLSLGSAELFNFASADLPDIELAASLDPRLSQVLMEQRKAHSYSVDPTDSVPYRELTRKLGIGQIMSIAQFDQVMGTAAGMVFCRASGPFEENSRRLLEIAFPLLLTAWTNCQLADLARSNRSYPTERAFSASSRRALLIAAEPQFLTLLRTEWPAWAGPHLPKELCGRGTSDPIELYLGAKIVIRSSASVDTSLLTIRPRVAVDDLTLREHRVAELCAQGKTYREISTLLDLAPSTTRNHIASIHRRLGVSRNSEVATQLRITGYLSA
jgi:DNA-binding CsgD family transcriptional regulator